ncbi:ABC transporter substrate-binding protein [Mesobacillus maritimus]|nr:ABC transporter substrate-binding protein [Mesobacillus maritimus]
MKPGLALLLSFVLIIPLAACGQEKKEKIRIAEVTRSIFYAPLYAALDQGFFEDEGLDIELTTVWGGDKVMTSLLSDGADIGLVGSETSIYVYARGASDPVINFGQLTQTDGTFLVSRNEIEDFSWDQLKDSTFLGQRKGGMPQMVGEFVLKKHGIDPQNDLNLIQNIDFANISSAFAGGTGEFVQLFEPQASIFEKEGRGHIVASFGTESGHVPYTTFMAKQSFMEENDETVEKFTRALYKAQQWVADTDAKKIAEAIQPYFEDTDLEILEMAVDRYKSQGSFATDPILDEEEWNNLQNIMEEAGELPTEVLHEELVNTTIAEKVMN